MLDDGFLQETVETEPDDTAGRRLGQALEPVVEVFNPFEALGEVLSDPESGLLLLLFIGAVVLVVLALCGLWSAVQEALSGGGPPQGLGLK